MRQLSEQCTLCVAHLLQLTVGLVETSNGEQPAPEAPAWPEGAAGKALLLRHLGRHMVSTLDDVVEVYMTALSTSVRPQTAPRPPLGRERATDAALRLCTNCANN